MDTKQLNQIDPWKCIDLYFKDKFRLSEHQTQSYDDFIENKIPDIISQFFPMKEFFVEGIELPGSDKKSKFTIHIDMKNPQISKPFIHENNGKTKLMFPSEARMRNFAYSSTLYVDMHIDTYIDQNDEIIQLQPRVLEKINIGKIPVMVRSKYCVLDTHKHIAPKKLGECKYDIGGYFIINGNERISDETIKLFGGINIDKNYDAKYLNQIIIDLYDTNYFENISLDINDGTLEISVVENPIIQNLIFEGIKSKKITALLKEVILSNEKRPYIESEIINDVNNIWK